MGQLTVEQIRQQLRTCDRERFAVLERSLVADTRKGVMRALQAARARLEAQEAERARLDSLYSFEAGLRAERGARIAVGLDEVGRGPLAGPLAVGAVVLPESGRIEGLNDSKQLSAEARERIADEIRRTALAWTVQYAPAEEIDALGISRALTRAFQRAVAAIEEQGVVPDLILLDGNPLHMDAREANIIKGDSRVASIAAASVIAKVERDALMDELDARYPGYGFSQNKGYGTAVHTDAIKRLGLTPEHRTSFCGAFAQETLF